MIGIGISDTATSAKRRHRAFGGRWRLGIGGLVALAPHLQEIGGAATGVTIKYSLKATTPASQLTINCLILVSNAASIGGVALISSGYLFETH